MSNLDADIVVNSVLEQKSAELSDKFNSDVVFLKSPMAPPVDDAVRSAVDEVSAANGQDKKDSLVVVLETNGGFIETVERIVHVFRKHYQSVDFIVPNYAYSAGTVLVMSGDEIWMDYHSVLGPIDPQYESESGDYVPGMGYLAKYEDLKQSINAATNTESVRAEIAYFVRKFDPAKLYHIEQAIEHSKSLLRDWLPLYKFKDWNNRQTSGKPVSNQDKMDRANEIAEILGKASRWHSHGRGITIDELQSDEIKLKINDFGEDSELSRIIRTYYSLACDFMGKKGITAAIHTKCGLRRVM